MSKLNYPSSSPASLDRRVFVVGGGGIGIVMAWCLHRTGIDVVLVESQRAKCQAGQQGITIIGHGLQAVPVVLFEDWQPEQNSIVLLCTKTYNNNEILKRIHNETLLLPVQNGFDEELELWPHSSEAIVSFVSECDKTKPITRITREGDLHIGPRGQVNITEQEIFSTIADALRDSGLFPVYKVEDIRPYKYAKLMYNAAISPLAAAAGIDNAELLDDPLAKKLFFGLLRENYAILKQAGISLAKIGPLHPDMVNRILNVPLLPELMALFFKPSLRGTYCSMSGDISHGQTEINAYNGYLLKLAGDFPCPLNRAAFDLITSMTGEGRLPERENLTSLAAQLPAGVMS